MIPMLPYIVNIPILLDSECSKECFGFYMICVYLFILFFSNVTTITSSMTIFNYLAYYFYSNNQCTFLNLRFSIS